MADQDGPENEDVNVVLTFLDGYGRSWLAGAHVGPLTAEDNTADTLHVRAIADLPIQLSGFTVVRGG